MAIAGRGSPAAHPRPEGTRPVETANRARPGSAALVAPVGRTRGREADCLARLHSVHARNHRRQAEISSVRFATVPERHGRLLGAPRDRPCHCTAEQHDDVAPLPLPDMHMNARRPRPADNMRRARAGRLGSSSDPAALRHRRYQRIRPTGASGSRRSVLPIYGR